MTFLCAIRWTIIEKKERKETLSVSLEKLWCFERKFFAPPAQIYDVVLIDFLSSSSVTSFFSSLSFGRIAFPRSKRGRLCKLVTKMSNTKMCSYVIRVILWLFRAQIYTTKDSLTHTLSISFSYFRLFLNLVPFFFHNHGEDKTKVRFSQTPPVSNAVSEKRKVKLFRGKEGNKCEMKSF